MSVSSLLAAALLQTAAPAAPAPDLSWLAGYWLDCSGGREASETWSDPRAGLIVGHSVTVRNGRSGFESARIAPLKDGGLAYFAQPDGAPATPFRLIDSGRSGRFSPIPTTTFRTASSMTARGMC